MGTKLSVDISESELKEIEKETGFNRSQVVRLCNRFTQLAGGRDYLTRDDLLKIPEVASNPLGERIVQAFCTQEDRPDNISLSGEASDLGHVDIRQFLRTLACFRPVKTSRQETDGPDPLNSRDAKLRFAFRMYDVDNDGNISRDELLRILSMMVGSNISDEQLMSIADRTMVEADADNDNQISFREFKEIMEKVDIEQRMSIRFLS